MSSQLSVVIATLGGDCLKDTIETLNKGSIVPNEILVCIPKNEASRVSNYQHENVKVIVTECRGQVAQRAVGFQNAQYDFVMQMDDDIYVDKYCIENLLKSIATQDSNVAVAPSFINLATGESVYKKPEKNLFIWKVYYLFMNGTAGYQPGKVNRAGVAVGVDTTKMDTQLHEVEWLAGGCVLHYKKNLILDNFYPFKGKAYSEDLIHSYYLKRRGIRLAIVPSATCSFEVFYNSIQTPKEFFKNITAEYRVIAYFMQLSSSTSLRIYFYCLIRSFSYLIKKQIGLYSKIVNNKK